MELILKNRDKTISIKSEYDDISFIDFMEDFVKPICHCAGYHPDNIKDYFDGDYRD